MKRLLVILSLLVASGGCAVTKGGPSPVVGVNTGPQAAPKVVPGGHLQIQKELVILSVCNNDVVKRPTIVKKAVSSTRTVLIYSARCFYS